MKYLILKDDEYVNKTLIYSKEKQENGLTLYFLKNETKHKYNINVKNDDRTKLALNMLLNHYQIYENKLYMYDNLIYTTKTTKDFIETYIKEEEEISIDKTFIDLKKLNTTDLPFFVLLNYVNDLTEKNPNIELYDDFLICFKTDVQNILDDLSEMINSSLPLCTRKCMIDEKNLKSIPECKTIYSDIKLNIPINKIYSIVNDLKNCKIWFNDTYFTILLQDSNPLDKELLKNKILNSKEIPIKVIPNNFKIYCPFTHELIEAVETSYKSLNTETILYHLIPLD